MDSRTPAPAAQEPPVDAAAPTRRFSDRARSIPLWIVAALGVAALAFDLTLRLRLPDDGDYAEAAAALRVRASATDAVQVWPAWAERARRFVTTLPVRAEEDLRMADYAGVRRLWLLALPRVPFGRLDRARAELRARGAEPGEELRFGAISLQEWDLRGPRVRSFLTSPAEEHEVDYVARQCAHVRIGPPANPARLETHGEGGALHLRAGIVGERAYQTVRGNVRVEVRIDGAPLAELVVPPTLPPEPGWRRLDVNTPAGNHSFEFLVSARDTDRPFCLSAWTTVP
ncbi:MAG TPA: hypothetical protein VE620_15435 [Myxococcales bacterium]|nr:hypothetical protein [Myxococcales bacterium]